MTRTRSRLPLLLALLVAFAVPAPARAEGGGGPYLTLLFSRTGITTASNCVQDDTGVARLDTVVAPALASLGLHPTGSIETGPTKQDAFWCGHYKETLFTSWAAAQQLASQYGWSFVSHTATYPFDETRWTALSTQDLWNETCGSEQQITAHGLPGPIGAMAWPNRYVYDPAMADVQACYDFSRVLGSGVTDQATATTPPYIVAARGFDGGPCNDPNAACYTYSFAHAPHRYRSPASMAQLVASAQPSQWLILQTYLLVTGSRPGYWDCTSSDWRLHWTYDTERYCWNDYLSVVSSLPAGVTVTDPASVGTAWGRVAPGNLPVASIQLSPVTSTIQPGETQTYAAEAYDSLGHDLGDVTANTVFTIDGSGACTRNLCGATDPGAYTVTGTYGTISATAQLSVAATGQPTIASFSPASGTVGTSVTISGGAFAGATDVDFGGASAAFTVASPEQIAATVPTGAVTGPITVTTPSGTASSATDFGVQPTIGAFSPTNGPVGTVVTIAGTGFAGATAVKFHGTPASFSIVSSTQLRAAVPAGATTGVITVSTAGGTARSGKRFRVTS